MDENRGWALVGKWLVGIAVAVGMFFGLRFVYFEIRESGQLATTREYEKTANLARIANQQKEDDANVRIKKLTDDLNAAIDQNKIDEENKIKAATIVSDHKALVNLVVASHNGDNCKPDTYGDCVVASRQTLKFLETGAIINGTAFKFVRAADGKIVDLQLERPVASTVVQPTLQAKVN